MRNVSAEVMAAADAHYRAERKKEMLDPSYVAKPYVVESGPAQDAAEDIAEDTPERSFSSDSSPWQRLDEHVEKLQAEIDKTRHQSLTQLGAIGMGIGSMGSISRSVADEQFDALRAELRNVKDDQMVLRNQMSLLRVQVEFYRYLVRIVVSLVVPTLVIFSVLTILRHH